MNEFNFEKKKVDIGEILHLLVEGSLFHSNNEVRMQGVELLLMVHKANPKLTVKWYKALKGLRPNIAADIEEKLSIN
jgi:hypothetical protein